MRRAGFLWLQIILVVSLVTASWFFVGNKLDKEGNVVKSSIRVEEIATRLLGCKINGLGEGAGVDLSSADFRAKERRLADLAVDAYLAGELEAFNNSITEIAGGDLSDFMYCHTALHKAGSRLYGSVEDFTAFFNGGVNLEGVCDNGLIHGYFDALGVDEGFSLERWEEISNNCSSYKGSSEAEKIVRTVCGDGAGHAVWQGVRDIKVSFERCLGLNDSLVRQSCVAGVMMQIPKDDADGKAAYFGYDEMDDRWGEVCKGFNEAMIGKDPFILFDGLKGFESSICGVMGGQNYSVYNSFDLLFGSENGSTGFDDGKIGALIDRAMNFCEGFSKEDDRLGCRKEYAVQGRFAVGFNKDLQGRYCALMPGDLKDSCFAFSGWCGTQRSEECERV